MKEFLKKIFIRQYIVSLLFLIISLERIYFLGILNFFNYSLFILILLNEITLTNSLIKTTSNHINFFHKSNRLVFLFAYILSLLLNH